MQPRLSKLAKASIWTVATYLAVSLVCFILAFVEIGYDLDLLLSSMAYYALTGIVIGPAMIIMSIAGLVRHNKRIWWIVLGSSIAFTLGVAYMWYLASQFF